MSKKKPLQFTREQARRFLLLNHGLLGPHRYHGEKGALAFISKAGSIQFDPLDICGRNPDLVLQSRVLGYQKPMLYELLYEKRRLVDYFDKELCIFPVRDWPHFARVRERRGNWMREHEQVAGAKDAIIQEIGERGPLSSKDFNSKDRVHWFWGPSRLSRAALEHLYYAGELGVSKKKGAIKSYDLIDRVIGKELALAPDPHPDVASLQDFLVKRRVGSVGLLWNRASAAFLGIPDLKTPERKAAFERLEKEGAILPVKVDGLRDTLYLKQEEEALANEAKKAGEMAPRLEFLAPLDNLLWDRKLVAALFDFDYTWEVYVPKDKRKYGYYVLPLLYGERLVGRIEPVFDKKARQLEVKNIWYEAGFVPDAAFKKALDERLFRFSSFCQS